MKTLGFRITSGKGFHLTFENGYTVSVQFGGGNYCDNYNADIGTEPWRVSGERGSSTAECAVWDAKGTMLQYGDWSGTVSNRSAPADVLALLNWAAAQPAAVEAVR